MIQNNSQQNMQPTKFTYYLSQNDHILLARMTELLDSINGKLTFFTVLTVLSIVVSVLAVINYYFF